MGFKISSPHNLCNIVDVILTTCALQTMLRLSHVLYIHNFHAYSTHKYGALRTIAKRPGMWGLLHGERNVTSVPSIPCTKSPLSDNSGWDYTVVFNHQVSSLLLPSFPVRQMPREKLTYPKLSIISGMTVAGLIPECGGMLQATIAPQGSE
jgi:hypothetical protein